MGEYAFAVNASHGRRSAYTTVGVTIEPGESPLVGILLNARMQSKFDPAKKLALLGSVYFAAGPGCDLCGKRWSAEVCADPDCAVSQAWSSVDLSTDGFVLTRLVDLNLVIDHGRLRPGVQYRFKLESWVGDSPTGNSMIQITTNLPPSGGLLTVAPTTGVSVQDTFHLIAANWVRQFTCCRSVGSLAGGHCILVISF